MTKVPVTCNRFMQPCGKVTTTMNMTLPPCLCNFKSIEWNPGVQTKIQVQLRGLSPILKVARMDKYDQLPCKPSLLSKYCRKSKCDIPKLYQDSKATKNKRFGSTHAQLAQKTISTLAPPRFNGFPPDFVCDQLAPKSTFSTKSRHRGG